MIRCPRPSSLFSLCKMVLVMTLVLWATVSTVLALRNRSTVSVIGIDDQGTRLILAKDDKLLVTEKRNFIKSYLFYAYNFSHLDYDSRISRAGDFMAESLWSEKREEFSKISKKIKSSNLSQEATIADIREVDSDTYEVDLNITIRERLKTTRISYRVELRLHQRRRSTQNPYPYEVIRYDEKILS